MRKVHEKIQIWQKINPAMHLILILIYLTPSVVLSTPLSTLWLHNDMPILPPSIKEGSYVTSDYVFTLHSSHIIFIIIIIINWSLLYKTRREWEQSQSKDPNPTQLTHGRKKKISSRRQKRMSRSCQHEALGLVLKPASRTSSNTGSLRLFQRDTKRGTKLLR